MELCGGDRYCYPFTFLALTGCRRGEALGLRWTDVNWQENTRHKSPLTTWRTYQHVVVGMQTDTAEKVAALIFGTGS